MIRKENQRIALTRRLLQEGLLRLLAHSSLEDISVTALCKEAGINRATFYNHYTSPTALLCEMEVQLVEELELISNEPTTIDTIASQLERYCFKLKENAELVTILVRYHADRDIEEIITKRLKRRIEDMDFEPLVSGLIEDAIDEQLDDIDIEGEVLNALQEEFEV